VESLWERIEQAFVQLESQAGYEPRPVQRQMARFVLECLQAEQSGVVEAPTGVGKSLAILLPALATCLREGKRIVISTYTNVLAEQYWYKDLPLARSLFPEREVMSALAMGRTRYACVDRIRGKHAVIQPASLHRLLIQWVQHAEQGTEGELAEYLRAQGVPSRYTRNLWEQISVPIACRASACSYYYTCFFYNNRDRCFSAPVVITNHALVLADARLRIASNGTASLLGDYHYLIVDEAHDLLSAAESALELRLSNGYTEELIRIAVLLSTQIGYAVEGETVPHEYLNEVQSAVETFAQSLTGLFAVEPSWNLRSEGVITHIAPPELLSQGYLKGATNLGLHTAISDTAVRIQSALTTLVSRMRQSINEYRTHLTDAQYKVVQEILEQFEMWFHSTYSALGTFVVPPEGVCWMEPDAQNTWKAFYQPISVSEALQAYLYSRVPTLMVSATLTVDGSFDFFLDTVGLITPHQLKLPSVFDYPRQCAIYLPPAGTIPDPPTSSRAPNAEVYYQRVAEELVRVLTATQGRALVLFSSRAEMEAVRLRMPQLPNIPIYMQGESANAELSKRFREETHSVLFGLRSFWTGFDAPGETLTNLVLVRLPFEVPTTPPQRARDALLTWQGKDTFRQWSLPNVKQQMRQGFGRLIRKATDRGVVCILDPRIYTKRYGAEILQNLPAGIPVFRDIQKAVRHVGLT